MGYLFSLIGIAAAAFAVTNLDDFAMLVAFFADPAIRPNQVVAGQFIGMAVLIALSLMGALLAFIVPSAWLGLMGLLPIAIGVTRLTRGGGAIEEEGPRADSGASRVATVALVTVSNGGDNLSLYIPLFAIRDAGEVAFICAAFLVLTGVWCVLALGLVRQGRMPLPTPLPRWTRAILPFAMIGLGGYILAKTDALALLLRPFLRLLAA